MTRGGQLLSVRSASSITDLTAGDGPFVIGVANKDLSLSELEAYLEINGPVHPDDTTGVELASRGAKVRILGLAVPTGDGTQASLMVMDRSLSGLKWSEEAVGWNWFIYNIGRTMTTGATWLMLYQLFVRWNRGG